MTHQLAVGKLSGLGVGVWLTVLCFAPALVAQDGASAGDLPSQVHELGRGTFPEDHKLVGALAEHPKEAAALLLEELHPVPETVIVNWEADNPAHAETLHVLWCLRALTFVTGGRTFTAKTSEVFGSTDLEETRRYFLTLYLGDGTVRFFAVRMSTAAILIAPQDAQLEILRRWREWFQNESKPADFAPIPDGLTNYEDWYFYIQVPKSRVSGSGRPTAETELDANPHE
jgi:hypothetical protein